jgi:hypothetical protein
MGIPTAIQDPEQTCLYASLRVRAYRNHIHGGYVLDVATLTAGKKHDRPGQLLKLPKFGGKSSIVSNIDQRLRNPERMLVPSPPRHRQPSVTESVALPPDCVIRGLVKRVPHLQLLPLLEYPLADRGDLA